MLVIAVLMLRRKSTTGSVEVTAVQHILSAWKGLLAGFEVGVMTGFLGVGGGFVIVPALVAMFVLLVAAFLMGKNYEIFFGG